MAQSMDAIQKNAVGQQEKEKHALLTRLAIELTFLARSTDEEFNGIVNRLRVALSRDKQGDELSELADTFFKYLLSGKLSREERASAAVAESARELIDVLGEGFPNVQEVLDLKQQLESSTSLDLVASSIRQLIPLLHRLGSADEKERGGTAPTLDAFGLVNDTVGPVLHQILERIHPLDPKPSRSQAIRTELETASSLADVERIMEQVHQLVIDVAGAIDQERGSAETLLNEVREQLKGLEAGVGNIVDVEASLANMAAMEGRVDTQVSGIQQSVNDSDDLQTLKADVSGRIGELSGTLSDYVDKERDQLAEAQQRIGDLTDQMHSMDAEIEELRRQVSEKHAASITDALTGVANRAGFDTRISDEFAASRRMKYPLSLMFIDVDHFKAINDTYGHKAGDTVLKTIAGMVTDRVRETDYVARYGGDEFVLLLPGTEGENAKNVGEQLLEKVRNAGFQAQGKAVTVTLSIGVTEVLASDSIEQALERADGALYKVKEAGRNGVQLATV